MMEEWRDIKGYEGYYQVSNEGRVKNIERYVKNKNSYRKVKERIIEHDIHQSGHHFVSLSVNNTMRHIQVHKLVAEAFIPNPMNFDTVHHKDHNPANNCVDNLEWVNKREHSALHNSKRVYQYTLDGELVRVWNSNSEVERECGYKNQNISACCMGKIKKYKGYIWSYASSV